MNKKLNDISQKLTGNNGNKYFLKNFNYKLTGKNGYFDKKITPNLLYHKHIIPDELVNYPITPKCNILIPLVVDTEFTAYNGDIVKLTKEKLQNLDNRQLIQIDRLDQLIKENSPDLKGIFELTGNKEIKQINSDVLDKVNFKAKPTLHLTSQIKHCLYNDAEILLNPDLKRFYEQYITNPDYKYPYYKQFSQCHSFDFLELKGFKIEIGKKNELDKEEFKFPDEIEDKEQPIEDEIEIEIVDDTPPEDKAHAEPMPKEIVEELEKDELEAYSKEAKKKMKQLKKVWNDERRRADSAEREQQEALELAKKALEENKKLKERLSSGEQMLVTSFKESVQNELDLAKREYREAYESGDTDRIIEAQEKITAAKIRADRIANYKPPVEEPIQTEENVVQSRNENQVRVDPKAAAWQERNGWFGQDEEMTSLALGLHEKLKKNGVPVGSDSYYAEIDKTMRRRFPEAFVAEEKQEEAVQVEEPQKVTKPKPTVVAPATRSTSPKKIRLSNTQVALAKKLGLTPEQYARELTKLEA